MRPLSIFTSPVWRWPAWLGVATALGLVCALIVDGWPDLVFSVALGLPVAVALWYGWGRPRATPVSRTLSPIPPTRQAASAPSTTTSEER